MVLQRPFHGCHLIQIIFTILILLTNNYVGTETKIYRQGFEDFVRKDLKIGLVFRKIIKHY